MKLSHFFDQSFNISKRSPLLSLSLQAAVVVFGFGVSDLLHRFAYVYTGSTTTLEIALIALLGSAFASVLFSATLLLCCDFRFPPNGNLFTSRVDLNAFLVQLFVGIVICLIVQALKNAYRRLAEANERETQLRQEAEKATLQMEKTLALVSHDVRNPIASMMMAAELIIRFHEKPEKRTDLANKIIALAIRADEMIQTLLDSARFKSGQNNSLAYEKVDLVKVLSSSVSDLSLRYSHRSVLLKTPVKSIFGFWAAKDIKRVIDNLVNNAIKYGSSGTLITVSLQQQASYVSISVHNMGNPIPLSEQNKLFDSFQRASTSTNTQGWGLGLASVKGSVEAQSGKIEVESSEIAGTTFRIDLPIIANKSQTDVDPIKVHNAENGSSPPAPL